MLQLFNSQESKDLHRLKLHHMLHQEILLLTLISEYSYTQYLNRPKNNDEKEQFIQSYPNKWQSYWRR